MSNQDDSQRLWVPPGHYHSPIPDLDEVRAREDALFDYRARELSAIELDPEGQFALIQELRVYYGEEGFPDDPAPEWRYHARNGFFPYSDAFFLFAMLRRFRPRRVVEVGSGFSSAVMLDTDERFPGDGLELDFVEPHPERLEGLLRAGDLDRVRIHRQLVQDVGPQLFDRLEADDFLFIDSSHVSKTGSDVNHLFFEVLPRLAPGVLVHVHDVPYPFEYGKEWVYEGRAWNEVYLLRAFLQFNRAFRVVLWPSHLASLDMDWARAWMPRCLDPVSSGIWLRRVDAK